MPSQFDALYERIFGKQCSKEGEAFERFAALITRLIQPNAEVAHDQRLRGEVSKSLYQIDVLLKDVSGQTFGEAKDYTQQNKPVGRGDLQKMAGAMLDVDANKGYFYSATGYTRPAKAYAGAANDLLNKPIELLNVRESVEADMDGRIRRIILNLHAHIPDYAHSIFTPLFAESARPLIAERSLSSAFQVFEFVDAKGRHKVSVEELTSCRLGDPPEAWGCMSLPDCYINYEGLLLELVGMEYKIPYVMISSVVEIEAGFTPKILVKSEGGTINRLISEEQLRAMMFDKQGNVVYGL